MCRSQGEPGNDKGEKIAQGSRGRRDSAIVPEENQGVQAEGASPSWGLLRNERSFVIY